jgi:hypothetical protein
MLTGRVKPLIDGDLLTYEVAFGVQRKDEDGIVQINSFDSCVDLFEQKVKEILGETEATEPPTFYLTASESLLKMANKHRLARGEEAIQWAPNFRASVGTTLEYKGGRKEEKPFHYLNLMSYMLAHCETKIAVGMEADDLMSIDQTTGSPEYTTVICSRDKDLRITPGWHFGWVLGGQPQFGPKLIDELGYIELNGKGKLSGGGLKFFYAQTIMGDRVDNVPGLPGGGPVLAYKTLSGCTSEEELFLATTELYKKKLGDNWRDYFKEQATLLWMCRALDENNNPISYVMYDER